MIRVILAVLVFSLWMSPAVAQDNIQLPCEVMEVSPAIKTDSSQLKDVHYMLVHHANAADRSTFSRWLKTRSGQEVTYVVNGQERKGVLCRLAHCFGRGLLIYSNQTRVKPRDIIELILPVSSSQ